MSEDLDTADELQELLAALREDLITVSQAERLASLLRSDAAARRTYIRYMSIVAQLHGGCADSCAAAIDGPAAMADPSAPAASSYAPVELQASSGFPSTFAPLGGFMFSYAAAIVILAVGLLIGWVCHVSPPTLDRQQAAAPLLPDAKTGSNAVEFVGQVSGMLDCRWADPRTAPAGFDRIALGRRYALLSGLMEITYDSGAKVILQGPCNYEVRSKTAGYLSDGRLTARIDKKRAQGATTARQHETLDRAISGLHAARSSSPLFSIETATATIADLGTEFGVEVDKSGICRTHVYQGKVELRIADRGGAASRTVLLGENDSVRVEPGNDRVLATVRDVAYRPRFVREMPKRLRIRLFDTGVNLKEGQPDLHWQAAARSDDVHFRPRPAIVSSSTNWAWLCNQPDRSQWISFAADTKLPGKPVYTFRTTFDLSGMRPATAVLHGRFVVDNHLQAIRINGRNVPVPKHGREEFGFFHPFTIDRGFVDGVNVLEMDVENTVEVGNDVLDSPMGLMVELDGSVLVAWPDNLRAAVDSGTK
jgi:hypothetical protein